MSILWRKRRCTYRINAYKKTLTRITHRINIHFYITFIHTSIIHSYITYKHKFIHANLHTDVHSHTLYTWVWICMYIVHHVYIVVLNILYLHCVVLLRAQGPFATYLYIAGYWAYLQKIYKVKIYKTTYWYVCNDHKNTVLRSEHFKWIRERKFGKNMKNNEKLGKIIKIDVY